MNNAPTLDMFSELLTIVSTINGQVEGLKVLVLGLIVADLVFAFVLWRLWKRTK